jgi:chemotaxis protein CheC
MVNQKVEVAFPFMKPVPLEEIPELIGGSEKLTATVYLELTGRQDGKKIPVGGMLLVLPEKSAVALANLLQGKEGTELTELDMDALEETGNVLSGTWLRVLSEFLGFEIVESLPDIAYDMLGATLNPILIKFAWSTEVLTFWTRFRIETREVAAYLFLLFYPEGYRIMSEKIREFKNGRAVSVKKNTGQDS